MLKDKIKFVILVISICLFATVVILSKLEINNYKKKIIQLSNNIALLDKTVEVQKNIYKKLSLQNKDLTNLMNEEDKDLIRLKDELKNSRIVSANSVTIKWKKPYEMNVKANSTKDAKREKIEFENNKGYLRVYGYTLTNPSEAYLKIEQNRPLKLKLLITQDKNEVWSSYVTSSEDNVGIDITLSAVKPYPHEVKWFNNIKVSMDIGVGNGFLGGVGMGYEDKFGLETKLWLTYSDKLQKYFGVNVSWHPFK